MTVIREKAVNDQVLNSWKEIARYLNRGVRTVQRWEAELDLPVRRPRGKTRSAVIAMRSEIDEWLNACPLAYREQMRAKRNTDHEPSRIGSIAQCAVDLMRNSFHLRDDLDRSRQELRSALGQLLGSIHLLTKTQGMAPAEARIGVAELNGVVGPDGSGWLKISR